MHGAGALNIDGCRIPCNDKARFPAGVVSATENDYGNGAGLYADRPRPDDLAPHGRWPANVVLSHAEGCERIGTKRVRGSHGGGAPIRRGASMGYGGDLGGSTGKRFSAIDGTEEIEAWRCAPGCPVADLDRQSGNRPGMSGGGKHRADYEGGLFGSIDSTSTARGDSGGASRFFYVAKTSTAEREAGCEGLPLKSSGELVDREEGSPGTQSPRAGAGRISSGRRNGHPTVKPIALMRWLCRLVTPPGGVVLDPFCGSGTTGAASILEGFRFVGIEREEDYLGIARARIAYWAIGGANALPKRRKK